MSFQLLRAFCFLSFYLLSQPILAAKVVKDTTPDVFGLTEQTGVAPNSLLISNAITISGINAASPLSVSGGEYSINGGKFKTAKTKITAGKTLRLQLLSSAAYNTKTSATVTIGGVTALFSVTTQDDPRLDRTPDRFSFIDQHDVALNTPLTSNAVTVSGINTPVSLHVEGGLYSIDGGEFVASDGTVKAGDSVRLRLISANRHEATTQATLSIGGVSAIFSATTAAPGFALPAASPGNPQFQSEHFVGSSQCSGCHNGLTDDKGQDVSIETDWSSTMMANASRDPYWRAKVRDELNQNPNLTSVIGDKCTRCHAPMANVEAHAHQEDLSVFDGGVLSADHPRHDEALNGVSCTLCHQIQNATNLGTLASFTGHYQIGNDKLIFGPFDKPVAEPMVSAVGYTPVYSEHMRSSKLCATCHNLKTPYVDEFGKVLSTDANSEFPEQMPYTEWEHSDFGKATPQAQSCQGCHMPRANGVKLSSASPELDPRDHFAIHQFVGANRLMLDIFNSNQQQLGTLSKNFPETMEKTQAMLNRAATLEKVDASLNAQGLQFTIKINSETGHKLPTSYPSRRVVLHVTVKNAQGTIVFESGKIDDAGRIAGVDNDDVGGFLYEPHHDLITSPDQVQVYEAIMADNHQQVTHTLLRGVAYLKDNRLLPKGFDKANAPNDVKVIGDASTDEDFVGGSDQVTYKLASLTDSGYTVEAELLHQPLSYASAVALFASTGDEIADFQRLFERSKAKTSRIAQKSWSISNAQSGI